MVVEHHDLDRQLVKGGGGEFEESHLETAVATDRDDGLIGAGKGGANGGGEAEAHGAGPSGGKPFPWGIGLIELGGPHLVLADVGGDDRIAAGDLVEFVDDLLHSQAALLAVGERVFLFPAIDFFKPRAGIEPGDAFVDLDKCGFGIADDFDVRVDHLVHFGGVDIDMDDFGVGAEFGGLANDSVVETGADVDQQVAAADGFIGVGGAVHAEHAEGKFVLLGEHALTEQSGSDRATQGFGQLSEFV